MMWFVVVYSDFTARRYSARKTPCSHQTHISANNGSDCCVHFCAPIKALHFRNRFEFTLKDWLKLRKLAASYLSRIRQKVAFFSTSAGSAETGTVVQTRTNHKRYAANWLTGCLRMQMGQYGCCACRLIVCSSVISNDVAEAVVISTGHDLLRVRIAFSVTRN